MGIERGRRCRSRRAIPQAIPRRLQLSANGHGEPLMAECLDQQALVRLTGNRGRSPSSASENAVTGIQAKAAELFFRTVTAIAFGREHGRIFFSKKSVFCANAPAVDRQGQSWPELSGWVPLPEAYQTGCGVSSNTSG